MVAGGGRRRRRRRRAPPRPRRPCDWCGHRTGRTYRGLHPACRDQIQATAGASWAAADGSRLEPVAAAELAARWNVHRETIRRIEHIALRKLLAAAADLHICPMCNERGTVGQRRKPCPLCLYRKRSRAA